MAVKPVIRHESIGATRGETKNPVVFIDKPKANGLVVM